MGIIWAIVIGFFAGLLARMIKPGNDSMGFILTTLLGIGGAVTANLIGRSMGIYGPGEASGFIASVIGAVILLIVVQLIKKKK